MAIFDAAGQQDWPTDPRPLPGVQACGTVGVTIAHRPARRQLRLRQPPR